MPSRHQSTETFQMDLRGSPAHENGSRSSSIQSRGPEFELQDNMGQQQQQQRQAPVPHLDPLAASELVQQLRRPHKLDLYSIPVFLFELLILLGLAYLAYLLHFVYYLEPLVSGFYCDDVNYRQHYQQTDLTKHFQHPDNELTVVCLLLAVPISLIIFFELINSMFGALKFRKIKAFCECCKLHSITRRSIRFSGAYILGFLFVSISCDILASSTGRLRPYFHQECPAAYRLCGPPSTPPVVLNAPASSAPPEPAAASIVAKPADLQANSQSSQPSAYVPFDRHTRPSMISHRSADPVTSSATSQAPSAAALVMQATSLPVESRIREAVQVLERQWIDLNALNYNDTCMQKEDESGDQNFARHRFRQLAKSWPSHPAALATYACLFIAIYLAYNGTARPVRLITSIMVLGLLTASTIFSVQLVKDHYHHWDDTLAGGVLATLVTMFVVVVYLNRFRDTHYYERQKMVSLRNSPIFYDVHRIVNKQLAMASGVSYGDYQVDKLSTRRLDAGVGVGPAAGNNNQMMSNNLSPATLDHGEIGLPSRNSADYNNDLAMRYFQIPRANYRGSPRAHSSLNPMR